MLQENTLIGAIAFTFIYAAATVMFIPGSVLTIGGGVAFGAAFNVGIGVLVGTICVWTGSYKGTIFSTIVYSSVLG